MEEFLNLLSEIGVVVFTKRSDGPLSLQTSCGIVLLHVAALSGSIANISLLLKLGIPIDVKNCDLTPLGRAVGCGNAECIDYLLREGANPTIKTSLGETLLHLAASSGQIEAIKILLRHKLEINAKDIEGLTPLYKAVEQDQFETADFLIKEGADIFNDSDGTTLLHLAASRGCITGIRCLLDLDFDIEAENDYGHSPLYFAAKAGKFESIYELMLNGADIDVRNKDGISLLHIAAIQDDEKAAKTLIEAGINVDITGGWWGLTPLHSCAANRSMNVAKILIQKKAQINFKTSDGLTPVDYARRNNDFDMVCFLTSFENMKIH